MAILLSESKVSMDSLPIKLNTSKQVFESIKKVSKYSSKELSDEEISSFFDEYELSKKYLNNDVDCASGIINDTQKLRIFYEESLKEISPQQN